MESVTAIFKRPPMTDLSTETLVAKLRLSWDADQSIISQTDKWMAERRQAADAIEALRERVEAYKAAASESMHRLDRARNMQHNSNEWDESFHDHFGYDLDDGSETLDAWINAPFAALSQGEG